MPREKKIWLKAECWVTKATLEVAQSAFLESGAVGSEIDDGIGPEGQMKYGDDRILVKAYFELEPGIEEEITTRVFDFFAECSFNAPHIEFSHQQEEDWQGNFVRSCTTFLVEPDIYIVPSFEIDDFKKQPKGDLFIEMDPENAFGTGQHQTTQLCLTGIRQMLGALPQESVRDMDCLDVGCGSGILAILMKKLGVKSVRATETDEDALVTAEKNAQKNGVLMDFQTVDESHIYPPARYHLVVANILAPVLIAMAENLSRCLKSHGHLILSGILLTQADSVIAAYQRLGLRLIKRDAKDDWCALMFTK